MSFNIFKPIIGRLNLVITAIQEIQAALGLKSSTDSTKLYGKVNNLETKVNDAVFQTVYKERYIPINEFNHIKLQRSIQDVNNILDITVYKRNSDSNLDWVEMYKFDNKDIIINNVYVHIPFNGTLEGLYATIEYTIEKGI